MSYKVSCYLQSLRKEWALSQQELGRLLGNVEHQHVSSLELDKVEPSVSTLFGLEIIFGRRAREIFIERFDRAEDEVVRALYEFQEELEGDTTLEALRKRQLIAEALSRVVVEAKQRRYEE